MDVIKNNYKICKSIDLGLRWLLYSGIQNLNKKNRKSYGSFNAWYDLSNKKFSYNYSEISGYFVTFMCFMYKVTNKLEYLNRARKAANWLINKSQLNNGGFKCLFLIDKRLNFLKKKELASYTFDNGVIINGLINLYKITKNKKYLYSATKCGDWICEKFVKKNFELFPAYNFKKKQIIQSEKSWSEKSGPYHTKVSMGLLNLYLVTRKTRYLEVAKKLNIAYLKHKTNYGDFKSTKSSTNFHPFFYSLEGYWATSNIIKIKNLHKILRKSLKWYLTKLKNKKLPRLRINKKFYYNERIDIYAQTLRMISLLKINNDQLKIDIVEQILNYQTISKNKIENGSFSWGKYSDGKLSNHLNSWVTAFVLQSFLLLVNKKAKKIIKSNPLFLV